MDNKGVGGKWKRLKKFSELGLLTALNKPMLKFISKQIRFDLEVPESLYNGVLKLQWHPASLQLL